MTRSRVPLPVLSDQRVLLRATEPRDVPAIEAGMHDPDVMRWIGPPEGSAQDVLAQNQERWARGSPTMSICELDGTCVGKVWMHIPEDDPSTGFVGYWLLPAGRGRGLATSAVRLLSTWAMRELGVTSVRLTAAPDNERSHRVAERSGFRRLSTAPDESMDAAHRGQLVFQLERAPRILVTGLSGTGKSSVLAELGRRGHRVVDTDDPGWREYRKHAEPIDELHLGEWHWVEDRMTALLDADDGRALFVAGCAANQSDFYHRFDTVVLLSAPVDVILDRVARRTTNDYGKTALERAMILHDLANLEPRLRASCTHELDASRPLDDVVADLVAIATMQ
jgi:RimJ/RimL family protein N-acetyltransferase/shikimate kinase